VFLFDKDSKSLSLKTAECLNKLSQWFIVKKLTLNLSKTCSTCMVFFSSEKNEDIKLLINNTLIEKVRSCKYLGIYIDDESNWHVHIYYIFNKLLKFTGIFYKLRAKLSYNWLKSIYRVARKNVPNFCMALCNRVGEMNQKKSMYVLSKHLRICP